MSAAISPACKWCPDNCGWYTSYNGGFAQVVPCAHCNNDGTAKANPKSAHSGEVK